MCRSSIRKWYQDGKDGFQQLLKYEEVESIEEYLPPINAPITSPTTVQEVIRISQAASSEINQEFTFIICDLAVAKLASQIIWQDPRKGWKTMLSKNGVWSI